jgi:hypothetical protein
MNPKANMKVILTGSYKWLYTSNCWWHEIKDIKPNIPLKGILSDSILV